MFCPCTHAHTPIRTLKSLVNFCSRYFLFHKKFDDSMLAKRHMVVGYFVRNDTGHVMQAIDITRHSRLTQQLVPPTTVLSFVCCSQVACKKKLLMTFGTNYISRLDCSRLIFLAVNSYIFKTWVKRSVSVLRKWLINTMTIRGHNREPREITEIA
jgi:hypothetical protein